MRRFDAFAAIILIWLLAAFSGDILLADAAEAGEPDGSPAAAMVAQAQPSAGDGLEGADPGSDRIAVLNGRMMMSWSGHELKLIGPNSIGIFREGGGDMVGVKSCRCSSDVGSCTPIVAEIPHYAFCAKGSGNACTGECTVE